MELKLLCVGDVVGAAGRHVLRETLATLVKDQAVNCVIVNAENAAAGSGLTANLHEKITRYGANLITMGDHIYRRRDIYPVLERANNIVKPANYPLSAPGKDFAVFQTGTGHRVAVISLLGRLYMKPPTNCPFRAVDRTLAAIPKDIKIVVVDMHAEATSEKVAMGWYLDGRVSVVFGTHTHIPTADERILPQGTAYITDLGMTGAYDSVLGRDKDRVVRTMISGVPDRLDVVSKNPQFHGIVVTVDSTTGRAGSIERVTVQGNEEEE